MIYHFHQYFFKSLTDECYDYLVVFDFKCADFCFNLIIKIIMHEI